VNIFMNVPQGGKFCFMTRKHSWKHPDKFRMIP
jgi:hypothetical protein